MSRNSWKERPTRRQPSRRCSGFQFKDYILPKPGGALCRSAVPRGAWVNTTPVLVATAESIDADVVGADRVAFERLGARYLRFR
jgi:hypothetical protein